MRLIGCQVQQRVMIDRIIDLKRKYIGEPDKEPGLISGAVRRIWLIVAELSKPILVSH
jgi:hypothetical protein